MSVFLLHVRLCFQALCHVRSSPLTFRCAGLSTEMSQCVSVHLYLNMQGLHRSADITHTLFPGACRVSGLSTAQLALQKKQPFLPPGYTKTGHSSITITLISRETKAQHSHELQTMQEIVNRGLNQHFSDMLKLVLQDSISKTNLLTTQ